MIALPQDPYRQAQEHDAYDTEDMALEGDLVPAPATEPTGQVTHRGPSCYVYDPTPPRPREEFWQGKARAWKKVATSRHELARTVHGILHKVMEEQAATYETCPTCDGNCGLMLYGSEIEVDCETCEGRGEVKEGQYIIGRVCEEDEE